MAQMRKLARDDLLAAVLLIMLVIMSWTSIVSMRTATRNAEILKTVKECVLPEGHLCKGNAAQTQQLVDSIVARINDHTDQVVGHK